MPKKRDPDATYGEKIIRLFATLLFTGQPKSLIDLANQLNTTKQSVMRMVDDINRSYSVQIDGYIDRRRKYYKLKAPKTRAGYAVSQDELAVLEMSRAFARHLLGEKFFEEAANTIGKTAATMAGSLPINSEHFATFMPGAIDYTPHHDTIKTLIRAMDAGKKCKITYKRITADKAKTFYIMPLKLFSRKDTLYLLARMAKTPGQRYREPDFDPLLAVHRIKKVEMTDIRFEYPKDYDFEKAYNASFGVMKEAPFEVAIEFTGWAMAYVQERIWSPDQKITRSRDGEKIELKFTASSEAEVRSWVLFFTKEATIIRPKRLRDALYSDLKGVLGKYS